MHETAPGLQWRPRANGVRTAYWVADRKASAAGYPVKTVNLTGLDEAEIVERCYALDAEMRQWLGKPRIETFDGTLGSLLRLYQIHEDSPYHQLKPGSRRPYDHYLPRLESEHGDHKLARLTGLDLKRWHKEWRKPAHESHPEKLGAAEMRMSILKAAFSFGFVSGVAECARLREVGKDLHLPSPKPRGHAPTAADVEAARKAAHQLGHPRAALSYAIQFETMARQWDVIGQWAPLSDPRPSAVLAHGQKWIGPTWAAIDAQGVLTIMPSKTERTTRAKIHVNLSACPMVQEELARIPEADRRGPLIVAPSGLPYGPDAFTDLWRAVRRAAKLPYTLWNRDLRAGGVTEAEIAGASVEDRSRLAGHSKKVNEAVYTRDSLAASDRVVEARARFRRAK